MRVLMILLHILAIGSVTTAVAGDYKMVKSQNDITIYERWIVRPGGAKVRQLKVVFTARTSGSNVISLLKNEQAGTKWNGRAETYKVIPTTSTSSWINYTRYATPFPMADQDWCVQYSITNTTETGNYAEVHFESIEDKRFPKDDDVKRITGVKGTWTMESMQDSGTKITYIIASNKDSSIPRWIADPVIHSTIFDTMTEFKKLLEHGTIEQ